MILTFERASRGLRINFRKAEERVGLLPFSRERLVVAKTCLEVVRSD